MHLKSLLYALLAAGTASLNAGTPELQWDPGKFGRISELDGKRILTVEVSSGEIKDRINCATAEINLAPFQRSVLNLRISARAENVTIPKHRYNGIKFMLNYVDNTGKEHWHNISNTAGSFEWKELSFTTRPIQPAARGKILLGLQDSSGKVEFDLSSLKIDRLFAATDDNYQAIYTDRVRKTPRLRGVMSPAKKFTEEDWKTLKGWNVNLVRTQICRNFRKIGTDRDLAEYDHWIDSILDHYEKMFKLGHEKYGLSFVIDLHTPPGGMLKNSDMAMFHEKVYADHFIEVWKRIATRFRGNPAVLAYDLINEPIQLKPAPYDYWNLQKAAAEAIRKIDPDTPIMIESNYGDSPSSFTYLPPLKMKDVIYQVHMYDPAQYTHQGIGKHSGLLGKISYPSVTGNIRYDRERLRKDLKPVREFQNKHNARIYVGEFSAAVWAPGADRYLADCIAIFEEYGWDWSYHAFREAKIWSLEHEGESWSTLRPSTDNPRKQILLNGFRKNRK